MSDVNDLASSLFGTSRAEVASGGTSTLYGTAATDSSGGSVSVRMGADTLRADGQAGTSVLVPTTTDVRAGETVIVTVVDGHPVVTGVVGSGDRLRTDVGAAQTTADSASSTAGAAKSTADSLATLIRADSTGITVGKSADGKTYSTGRTHMTDSAFEVLDKAGAVITQLAADGASFLSGLVKMIVGKTTLPGNLTVNSITIDSGGGVAVLRGIISRLSANLNGVTSSVSAGWEQDFGYGVTAIVRESAHLESAKMVPERTASAHLASDKAELYVGDNSMKVTGGGFELSHPEYLRKGLRITQGSKVCHGHGTPWVTLFETWAEFQSATGCYDSGTPTLVTMNGDWHAFDGTLSGCEICGGKAVYVMAQTTSGLLNISSTQSLRINWICIW